MSTTDPQEKDNIVNFIRHEQRIFPIGRLDKDSQGLILLTNDGDIVNKILRAGNNHKKDYLVKVDRPITSDFLTRMAQGGSHIGQGNPPVRDSGNKSVHVPYITHTGGAQQADQAHV